MQLITASVSLGRPSQPQIIFFIKTSKTLLMLMQKKKRQLGQNLIFWNWLYDRLYFKKLENHTNQLETSTATEK